MKRPISIGLSPNLEGKDIFLALRLLCFPHKWFVGRGEKKLEDWFEDFFPLYSAISFVSGRGALFAVLQALGITDEDEVLLQAFTCSVVPNAVISSGAKPIYVDIADSLTIDPQSVERNITKKTKAIIVQHTFGIPSDMDAICIIAKKHNLFIIEDCAHTIGGEYKGKKLGSFGDASIFSFGRDKAFSSVFGGMAIAKNKTVIDRLRVLQNAQSYPSIFWVFQQLLHPIAFSIILPLYDFFGIGKVILVLLQNIKLLSFPVRPEEKKGKMPLFFVKRMPNALAEMALLQLSRIIDFNNKRQEAVNIYRDALYGKEKILDVFKSPLLRFPLFVQNRDALLLAAKRQHIYLGKWYSEIVDPKDVDLESVQYIKGSCPNAEKIAQKVINLPTYPTLSKEHQERVIKFIKTYVRSR